jgi:hypothetical protein
VGGTTVVGGTTGGEAVTGGLLGHHGGKNAWAADAVNENEVAVRVTVAATFFQPARGAMASSWGGRPGLAGYAPSFGRPGRAA